MSVARDASERSLAPRWLHAWAILTVCATVPMLLLGTEVTTKKAGMVDDHGFRFPWHMFTIPDVWAKGIGFVIEHSHRFAAYTIGACIIVLAVGLWRREPRRWVRWAGMAALAGVIIQGLLGGFRVQLNALMGPRLALIHGCFAQLVFALLVSLAVFTSRSWSANITDEADPRLRRWTLLVACLAYLQIVLGAIVRHTESPLGPRLHVWGAFVLMAAVIWLARLVLDKGIGGRAVRRSAGILAALVVLQIMLGVETWLAKFAAAPEWPQLRPLTDRWQLIPSLHYLAGSCIFATAVVAALQAYRSVAWNVSLRPAPIGRLEGAA